MPLLAGMLSLIISILILLVVVKAWIGVGFLVIVLLFTIHLFTNTNYCITENKLNIRSGLIYRMEIDIGDIRKIMRTDTILSSPALAFNKVEIIYNKFDSVLISPKNQEEFIAAILQINPTVDVSSLSLKRNNGTIQQ